jgi:tetratricopeptide (TPR) repeat protein
MQQRRNLPIERVACAGRRACQVLCICSALFAGCLALGSEWTIQPAASFSAQVTPPASSAPEAAPAEEAGALSEARALLQHGKAAEAERSVRTYLATHANSADAHFLLGYILYKEVKAKESLAEYTEGAKHQVPRPFELKVVAIDYVLLGDYVDADKWLTRSLRDMPKDSDGWYYLGRVKYNENRFEEAASAFQQCLKLDPKNVKAEDNLGLSFQGLGRNEEASTAYQAAIAWQADVLVKNPDPFINMGSLMLELNRPQEAVAYLGQALTIPPEVYRIQGVAELQPRAHELLGKAYLQLNQLEPAQRELEKAVELAPQSVRPHFLLGQVYRREGLTAKAKAEFDRCAALAGTQGLPKDGKP